MGQRDSIYGQVQETARCRDAQHGDGVCCALAPQSYWYFDTHGLVMERVSSLYKKNRYFSSSQRFFLETRN